MYFNKLRAALNCLMGRTVVYNVKIDFLNQSLTPLKNHSVIFDNIFIGLSKLTLPYEEWFAFRRTYQSHHLKFG